MAAPVTTLVPFANLPACAQQCGPLYDVNGACVPPAAAQADSSTYDACFCKDPRLAAFSTASTGVCDAACTADSGGLGSIQGWYTSFCSGKNAVATTGTQSSTSSSSTATSSGSASSGAKAGNGSWLSTHWQWVIFIVVVVVGIAGIWIGAAIWRRRYLRRKDRQYALGKTLAARTNSGMNPYGGPGSNNASQSQRSVHMPRSSMFQPANLSSANVYDEKPPKEKRDRKKVSVTERH